MAGMGGAYSVGSGGAETRLGDERGSVGGFDGGKGEGTGKGGLGDLMMECEAFSTVTSQ